MVFGATGFAGGLTADYLAAHLPPGACWGIAGRHYAGLRDVRDRLVAANPAAPVPELLLADSTDPHSLAALAGRTRVVATTVGPYLDFGEQLVAACAAAGTDYLDLCGEPEFVDRMYLDHHATAVRTGARMVHACGFDSVPHDLGVLFTVGHLPRGVPLAIRGIVRGDFRVSGGTVHATLGQFSRMAAMRRAQRLRRASEPRLVGRRVRVVTGVPHRDPDLGVWLVPMPTIDPQIVARSAAARDDYGPDVSYSHYAGVTRPVTVAGAVLATAALVVVAQVPPLRRVAAASIPAGDGPTPQRRARSWFRVDIIGEGGGQTVHARIEGGDPGYTETAMMLSEAAMCLAFDDNPPTAGQVTTATAMGENLLRRVMDAGLVVTVVGRSPTYRRGRSPRR